MDSLSFIQNSLFRATVPTSFYAPKWLKCKPNVWMFIGRTVWILGYHKDVESYKEVREGETSGLLITSLRSRTWEYCSCRS